MKRSEQILWAMTDLGDDLVDTADQLRFARPLWRQILPAAVCVLLLMGTLVPLLQLQSEPLPGQEPGTSENWEKPVQQPVKPTPQEQEGTSAFEWQPEPQEYYALPLETGGYVAVKKDGTVLLNVETGTLGLMVDEANGEVLAIQHIVHPDDPHTEQTVMTFYDLDGSYVEQINAWSVQCLGDVVLVDHGYGDYALYRREDRTPIQTGAIFAHIAGGTVMMQLSGETYYNVFYDARGELVAAYDWGFHLGGIEVWNGNVYYAPCEMYRDQEGNWTAINHGIFDNRGNVLAEPGYEDTAILSNGYGVCVDGTESLVLDLDTGTTVTRLPVEYGVVVGAYENLLLVNCDDDPRTVNRVYSWDGAQIGESAQSVRIIDDEGDGVAELLQFYDGGDSTVYRYPDGTLLRQLDGLVEAVTSRTAVQMMTGLALIDLQTGEEQSLRKLKYTEALPLWPTRGDGTDYTSGLFFASYSDEQGNIHTDILREDGTLVLEQYSNVPYRWTGAPENSGLFPVTGGYRYLDGTWLYRTEE